MSNERNQRWQTDDFGRDDGKGHTILKFDAPVWFDDGDGDGEVFVTVVTTPSKSWPISARCTIAIQTVLGGPGLLAGLTPTQARGMAAKLVEAADAADAAIARGGS